MSLAVDAPCYHAHCQEWTSRRSLFDVNHFHTLLRRIAYQLNNVSQFCLLQPQGPLQAGMQQRCGNLNASLAAPFAGSCSGCQSMSKSMLWRIWEAQKSSWFSLTKGCRCWHHHISSWDTVPTYRFFQEENSTRSCKLWDEQDLQGGLV